MTKDNKVEIRRFILEHGINNILEQVDASTIADYLKDECGYDSVQYHMDSSTVEDLARDYFEIVCDLKNLHEYLDEFDVQDLCDKFGVKTVYIEKGDVVSEQCMSLFSELINKNRIKLLGKLEEIDRWE